MTDLLEERLQRHAWLTPLVLLLLTLGFFHRVLLTPGGVLVGEDLLNFFYPQYTFVVHEVRARGLPLWNPHLFAGISVVADPQIAIYYPPNWLLLLLDVQRGETLLLVAHVWWAAWGMSRFTRALGASATGGLLGGIIWGFNSWAIAHIWAGHYTVPQVASWLPWTLLAFQHALQHSTWRAALPGMAVFGLSMLAGSPPVIVHLGLLLFALAIFHVVTEPDRHRAQTMAIRHLELILLGGMALSAIQIVPLVEITSFSSRGIGGSNYLEAADSFPLPAAQWLTLLLPNLLGSPVQPHGYWGGQFYEELTGYASLWAWVAVILVLRRQPRNVAIRLFLAIGMLGAILSLGTRGGLLTILLRWVPLFQVLRVPARYLNLVMFALAGLSALVLTNLQHVTFEQRRAWVRPAWRIWAPAGALAALGAAGGLLVAAIFSSSATHVERLGVMAGVLALTGGMWLAVGAALWLWQTRRGARWASLVLLGVVVVDLWRIGMPLVIGEARKPLIPLWDTIAASVPSGDPTIRVMPLQRAYNQNNGASVSDHYNIYGYQPLEPVRYLDFVSLSFAPTAPNNRLLGVQYMITTAPIEELGLATEETVDLLAGESFYIYHVRDAPLPRVFLVSAFEVEPDDAAARARLMSQDFSPERTVILDQEPACPVVRNNGTATLSDYAPNHVTIHTQASAPTLLVLTDRWYPGWTANVDGVTTEVFRAYTVLRAVCVPGGEHTVTFQFRPTSWRWGARISLAGWAVLGLVTLIPALRRVIARLRTASRQAKAGER